MNDPIKLFKVPAGAKLENLGGGLFRVTCLDGRVEEISIFYDPLPNFVGSSLHLGLFCTPAAGDPIG